MLRLTLCAVGLGLMAALFYAALLAFMARGDTQVVPPAERLLWGMYGGGQPLWAAGAISLALGCLLPWLANRISRLSAPRLLAGATVCAATALGAGVAIPVGAGVASGAQGLHLGTVAAVCYAIGVLLTVKIGKL